MITTITGKPKEYKVRTVVRGWQMMIDRIIMVSQTESWSRRLTARISNSNVTSLNLMYNIVMVQIKDWYILWAFY